MVFVGIPGTSEFVRRWSPRVGDIVSFKHRGFMLSGKPKSPSLYRIRNDLKWEDVIDRQHDPRAKGVRTDPGK